MEFEYSIHYLRKMKYRPDIAEYLIEYAITHSDELKDKYWEEASMLSVGSLHQEGY